LWYRYATKETLIYFLKATLWFSTFAIISATVFLFFPQIYEYHQMPLLMGTYGHNMVIIPILFSCAASAYLYLETKKSWYFLFFLLFVVGSILSFSRAGLLAETVVIVGLIISGWKVRGHIPQRHAVIAGIMIMGLCILLLIPYKNVSKEYKFANARIKVQNLLGNRMQYWSQAVNAFKEAPLWGHGPGTFYIQSLRLEQKVAGAVDSSHNLFLDFLTEMGIFGTVLVLLLIGAVMYPVIFSIRKQKSPSHIYAVALLLGIASVVLQTLADVSLNFFIPSLLMWATIGTVAGEASGGQKKGKSDLVVVRVIQIILSFLILVAGGDQLLPYLPGFSCEHIRTDELYSCFLYDSQKNKSVTQTDISIDEVLHKKNSRILYVLGLKETELENFAAAKRLLSEAVINHPFNRYIYSAYFSLLAKQEPRRLGNEVETMSCKTFDPPLCARVRSWQLGSETFLPALTWVYTGKEDDIVVQEYAVLFYRLGLYFLRTNPEITKDVWTFIRDAHPGWGPFHSELASFYEYTLNDHTKAVAVLEACQTNKAAASECKLRLTEGLSPPGSLESVIIWNWDF